MTLETLILSYDYSPYQSQQGDEIPAFEIFDAEYQTIAETNENMTAEEQEKLARLFAASPELLRVLQAAHFKEWVHNAAITDDIEALRKICLAYAAWWNEQALPVIALAKGQSGKEE